MKTFNCSRNNYNTCNMNVYKINKINWVFICHPVYHIPTQFRVHTVITTYYILLKPYIKETKCAV